MEEPDETTSKPDTVSSLVRHLEQTLPEGEDMTVARLLSFLGVHGFIFLLLILACLNIFIFMLPGLSIVFGLPMVILSVQMLLGQRAPIFPAFVRLRKIRSTLLRRGLHLAVVGLEKIEPRIKPRLCFLTSSLMMRVHSLVALCLALMVAIPVPFINLPPSLGMVFLTIGLLQRDGVFIAIAYAATLWSFHLYESLGQMAQHLVG
ncbi:MAG: exopolysaccharide biosynthesis protein [Bdellovibrionales bacterium]|jgi:hypothetical protein